MASASAQEKLTAGEQIAQYILSLILSEWQDKSKEPKIALFRSFTDELNTVPLIKAAQEMDLRIFVANYQSKLMTFYEIDCPQKSAESDFDYFLVPGVAFDKNGGRLGRGRGFYDRYLQAFPQKLTIGIAGDWQLVNEVPCESHDVRMNALCTPGLGVISCK